MNAPRWKRRCCVSEARYGAPHQQTCCRYTTPVTEFTPEQIAALRAQTIVPHASKCSMCGASVVTADPLPHQCGEAYVRSMWFDWAAAGDAGL